jgi:hypothetical protein
MTGGNEEQGVRRHAAEDGVDHSLDVLVWGRKEAEGGLQTRLGGRWPGELQQQVRPVNKRGAAV